MKIFTATSNATEQLISNEQSGIIQRYLQATLNHYQRMQQGSTVDVSHIIEAYR